MTGLSTQTDLPIAAREHASAERLDRYGDEVASAMSLGDRGFELHAA